MTTVLDNVSTKVKKYSYSEIFGHTFQGEAHYTGIPTIWLRFWGCNFECKGFGQEHPEDPSTYDLDYENIDISKYSSMEELPVFHRGCDSSYSWAKKFKHLAHTDTAEGIVKALRDLLPGSTFQHPKSKQYSHLAFTGGEPMMSQTAIVDILKQFDAEGQRAPYITIETNGTQPIRSKFKDIQDYQPRELFWSVSPKLYLSGEKWEDAIQPGVVAEYKNVIRNTNGQLKYVSNGTQRSWDEVEKATDLYREAGVDWPVWIMPVGADLEMQESHQAKISDQAIERGYNVAARVHVFVYGNVIGK